MSDIKTSESRRKAKREWLDKNMESMNVSLKPGTKDAWKGYAAKSGLTLVEFIRQAVEEKAEHDGLKEANKEEGAD